MIMYFERVSQAYPCKENEALHGILTQSLDLDEVLDELKEAYASRLSSIEKSSDA